MSDQPQFSLGSAIALLCVLAYGGLMFAPVVACNRRTSHQMKNSANLRGIAQSMVIFGNSNDDFLPGFDKKGNLLPASPSSTGSLVNTGAAGSSRLWVLLDGKYIGPDLLINHQQRDRTTWTAGTAFTTSHFSYAALQIGDSATATTTKHHDGRAAEWKNNANSRAIWMGDRKQGKSDADADVQTEVYEYREYLWGLFTSYRKQVGPWKGNLVWGDVHAGYEQSHYGFTTRYSAATNSNDNLFVTASGKGITETSAVPDANTMLTHE